MFEAVHGSAPDIAGQGIANPTGLLLSACLMLDHIDQHEVSSRIRSAIDEVIHVGQALTVDMGGGASTTEYTDALVQALA